MRDLQKVAVLICPVHLLGQDLQVCHVNVKQILETRPLHLDHNHLSSVQDCPVYL